MSHRGWICLLLLTASASAQSDRPNAPSATPRPPAVSKAAPARTSEASTVAPNAAVITIPGLCDKPSLDKSKPADCKTVVTRAEFEELVDAVAPTIAPAAKKQLATQYGVALVMVHKAHQMGLDKGPKFEELMRVARISVLTKELSQSLQDEAARVSDQDVAAYYQKNEPAFQEIELQRIFIPRSKQIAEGKDKPAGDEAKKAQQESEETMQKLADTLAGAGRRGRGFRQTPGRGRQRRGLQGKAADQAGQGAALQPASHASRSDEPEAGRNLASDFNAERFPHL